MRLAGWVRRHWRGLAWAFCGACFVVAVGMNRQAIDKIETVNCSLATLVQVSLDAPPFGEGVDRAELTPFDRRVLRSINRVQALAPTDSEQIVIFRAELDKLKDAADHCELPHE